MGRGFSFYLLRLVEGCWLALTAPIVLVTVLRRHTEEAPWVISGHKGQLYEDNSRCLHHFIHSETAQPIIWISSNTQLTEELRIEGKVVLPKHSIKARAKLIRAPVLIYSHGEDDLDNFIFLVRPLLGRRILLRHGLTFLKGHRRRKRLFAKRAFDWALACNEFEAKNFKATFPEQENSIVTGGGAHLDRFIRAKDTPTSKQIVYMPTYRESGLSQNALKDVFNDLCRSAELRAWLSENHYTFTVARHINQKTGIYEEKCDHIAIAEPSQLMSKILECELLISDYSAILSSFLVLDRPVIFFPFDIEEYQRHRSFYMSYEDFRYDKKVSSTKELIRLLTSNEWRTISADDQKRRKEQQARFYPYKNAVYSRATYETICKLLQVDPIFRDDLRC